MIHEDKGDLSPNEIYQTELAQLMDLAKNVGSYTWQYDGDSKFHDGPVAQELLKCEGLKDAVVPDSNGVLTVDTKYVAMATLGYVAALARIILGVSNDGE